MEMGYIGFAVFVSLTALVLALEALHTAKVTQAENAAKKGKRNEKNGAVFEKTDADRIREAVARREHENFMSYDGTEQPEIDPDRILGE